MTRVFIDGEAGTTGLQIAERLALREDLTLLRIDAGARKDNSARRDLFAAADIAILCLPDDAAREAVTLAAGHCRLIDASTAHRTHPDWVYGLPELDSAQRARIAGAERGEALVPRLRLLGRLLRGDHRPGRHGGEPDPDRRKDHGEVRTNPVDDRHRRLGEVVVLDLGNLGGLHRRKVSRERPVGRLGPWSKLKNRDACATGVKTIIASRHHRADQTVW